MTIADPTVRRRNRRTALAGAAIVAAMVALVAVSPTLYAAFCRVTGYGGTTQRADGATVGVLDRMITVRFDANIDPILPWMFRPKQKELVLRVGEIGMAFYESRNIADRPVTGMATFNVTPLKAGLYFQKIHCFCFNEQTLAPGQQVDMPVQFFVDPAIADDKNLDDVQTITLSYTFFAQDPIDTDTTDTAIPAPHRQTASRGAGVNRSTRNGIPNAKVTNNTHTPETRTDSPPASEPRRWRRAHHG